MFVLKGDAQLGTHAPQSVCGLGCDELLAVNARVHAKAPTPSKSAALTMSSRTVCLMLKAFDLRAIALALAAVPNHGC